MRLRTILFTFAAIFTLCPAGFAAHPESNGSDRNGINKMFLDAHATDQPPEYSRSEIKKMIQEEKTAENFERLASYFDYQSMEFDRKADDQVKELERLLALPFHARSYPTQVENTRELIKKYRTKADECSARASVYRTHATKSGQMR